MWDFCIWNWCKCRSGIERWELVREEGGSGRSNIIEREVNKQVGDLFQDKKGLKVWLYINYIEVPVLHSIDLYKVIAINILFNYFNNLEN